MVDPKSKLHSSPVINGQVLVSVIMITYNHEKYIEEAVNGVLMQKTNFDYELIVANDQSTDQTDNVIKRILLEHPLSGRVHYIEREKNIGMVANFIDTTKQSRGKYIALCEGDDYWTDPLKLQKQVNFLEKNIQYSMVCHNALVINQINNSSRLFYTTVTRKTFSTAETLNVHLCPTASILFRKLPKTLLDQFPTENGAGDQMLVQMISVTGLIYRIDDVMSVYRVHFEGVTQLGKISIIQVLKNRKSDLWIFNKISNKKFQTNILIEIFLINRRISYLRNPSKVNFLIFKISRKIAGRVKKVL